LWILLELRSNSQATPEALPLSALSLARQFRTLFIGVSVSPTTEGKPMQVIHHTRNWASIIIGVVLLNIGAFATASVAGAIVGIPLVIAGLGLLTSELRG
jgi:hypothetical protein